MATEYCQYQFYNNEAGYDSPPDISERARSLINKKFGVAALDPSH